MHRIKSICKLLWIFNLFLLYECQSRGDINTIEPLQSKLFDVIKNDLGKTDLKDLPRMLSNDLYNILGSNSNRSMESATYSNSGVTSTASTMSYADSLTTDSSDKKITECLTESQVTSITDIGTTLLYDAHTIQLEKRSNQLANTTVTPSVSESAKPLDANNLTVLGKLEHDKVKNKTISTQLNQTTLQEIEESVSRFKDRKTVFRVAKKSDTSTPKPFRPTTARLSSSGKKKKTTASSRSSTTSKQRTTKSSRKDNATRTSNTTLVSHTSSKKYESSTLKAAVSSRVSSTTKMITSSSVSSSVISAASLISSSKYNESETSTLLNATLPPSDSYNDSSTPTKKLTISDVNYMSGSVETINENNSIKILFSALEEFMEYTGNFSVTIDETTTKTFPYFYTYLGDNKMKLKFPVDIGFTEGNSTTGVSSLTYGELTLNYNTNVEKTLIISPYVMNGRNQSVQNDVKFEQAKIKLSNDNFLDKYSYYKARLMSIFGQRFDPFSRSKTLKELIYKIIATIPLLIACITIFWVCASIILLGLETHKLIPVNSEDTLA